MRFSLSVSRLLPILLLALMPELAWAQTETPAAPVASPASVPAPTAPVATTPVAAPLPSAISAAETRLVAAEAEIARLTKKLEEVAGNDGELVNLKVSVEELARSMLDIGVSLRPRLNEIKSRIDQMGPVPGDGAQPEPQSVVEERAKLAEERALINTLTGRAELVSVRASELANRITEIRRALFTNTLLKRTVIDLQFFSDARTAFGVEQADFQRTVGSWLSFVWSFKTNAVLATVFFSLMAALFFVAGGYRLFGSLIVRDPDQEDPPYISRLSVAFWSTVFPTASMAAVAVSTYAIMNSFAVMRGDITPIVTVILVALVAFYFVGKLARGILSPFMPAWRLVHVSDGGARVLFWLVIAMAVINGADYVFGGISVALGSPVVLTVAKGFFAAILIGLVLIAMSRIKPMLARSGDATEPGLPWPRLISAALMIAGLTLIMMAILGYVGLARFAATQIVVTGAILATMYIGYLSGKAVSRPAAFAETAVGRFVERRFSAGQVALDQAGLAAGLLINLLVLLLGVPLILLQWGFHVQDIEIWLVKVLTDIRIGGITISLFGILIGILLFAVGLLATRWFQRWLDGNVMARGRVDAGVRNSIKTGIGYLGVAVAGLFAISAAGIDLSSLALVAGALSLGIGFGLQNIVSNFVSGLILLAERPFKVGDWVISGAAEGFVKKISVRATEIETFQRQSIIVPNSELINASVGNWTHRNRLGRIEIGIGVGYGSDPRRVMEILQEVVLANKQVLRNPEPVVHFLNFGESSLDFEVRAFVADILSGLSLKTELRLAIFERLKAEEIEIPFPQRDLNIKVDESALPLAAGLAAAIESGRLTISEPGGAEARDEKNVGG